MHDSITSLFKKSMVNYDDLLFILKELEDKEDKAKLKAEEDKLKAEEDKLRYINSLYADIERNKNDK